MYAVYKDAGSDVAKVLDIYFINFEQSHYYVMLQPGRQGQPQSATSFKIANAEMLRNHAVSYSGYHIRRVKAIDANYPRVNYKEQYQNTVEHKTAMTVERAVYDLEEVVAELTSAGLSRKKISGLFQKAADSQET
jgi:hypothetical protein